jgi:hypothetical protein
VARHDKTTQGRIWTTLQVCEARSRTCRYAGVSRHGVRLLSEGRTLVCFLSYARCVQARDVEWRIRLHSNWPKRTTHIHQLTHDCSTSNPQPSREEKAIWPPLDLLLYKPNLASTLSTQTQAPPYCESHLSTILRTPFGSSSCIVGPEPADQSLIDE